jgi:hypothetical protein
VYDAAMQVFIFRSEKDTDVVGFTAQRDGRNLPVEYAPWKSLGGNAIQTGDNLAGVTSGADNVREAIRRDGFYLGRSEVRVTSRSIPPSR